MSPATVHELTINKVLAGAGAAVTSAVLGSFFGVAGTVVGAAVGSVASTIATTLYESSLDRTREAILAKLRAGSSGDADEDGPDEDGQDENRPPPDEPPPDRTPPRHRMWIRWVGATAVAFLLGMLVITGVEWVKGSTVAGVPGTSVGVVLAPASTPTTDPTPRPSTKSREADATEAPSKHAKPSATTSPSRTPTATATTPPAATQDVSPG